MLVAADKFAKLIQSVQGIVFGTFAANVSVGFVHVAQCVLVSASQVFVEKEET